MRERLRGVIALWFAADLVLGLLPPLHWAASGGTPILGMPRVLVYLFGSSAFIAASVVFAYFGDSGAPKSEGR